MKIIGATLKGSRSDFIRRMKIQHQVHGRGEPFVYVPGIEGTGKLFYKQLVDLERDHRIITFPLRAKGRYGMGTLVDDLASVMRDAGAGRATVLGESFGGMLAMAAALEHPEFFKRLILVNTFPFFVQRARIKFGVAIYSILPYALVKAYRRRRAGTELFSSDIADEDRRLFRDHTQSVPFEGYLSRLRIIRDMDLRARLPEIKVPTLVVAGTTDGLIDSVSAAQEIAANIPGAKLKLLEGTGHCALLSSRVRVRDWIAELDAQTPQA